MRDRGAKNATFSISLRDYKAFYALARILKRLTTTVQCVNRFYARLRGRGCRMKDKVLSHYIKRIKYHQTKAISPRKKGKTAKYDTKINHGMRKFYHNSRNKYDDQYKNNKEKYKEERFIQEHDKNEDEIDNTYTKKFSSDSDDDESSDLENGSDHSQRITFSKTRNPLSSFDKDKPFHKPGDVGDNDDHNDAHSDCNVYIDSCNFSFHKCDLFITGNCTELSENNLLYAAKKCISSCALISGTKPLITSVTVANDLKKINSSAFQSWVNLRDVKLTSVDIIDNSGFDSCTSLERFSINYVEHISDKAFYLCSSLSVISLPGLISLGKNVFQGCSNMISFYVPSTLEDIGTDTFIGCSKLSRFNIENDNLYYQTDNFGVLYNFNFTYVIAYPNGRNNLQYRIADTTTYIGRSAFISAKKLINIEFPEGLMIIGYQSFMFCESLEEILLPTTLYAIFPSAFFFCKSLAKVVIQSNLTMIGSNSFEQCPLDNGFYYCAIEAPTDPFMCETMFGSSDIPKIYVPTNFIQTNGFCTEDFPYYITDFCSPRYISSFSYIVDYQFSIPPETLYQSQSTQSFVEESTSQQTQLIGFEEFSSDKLIETKSSEMHIGSEIHTKDDHIESSTKEGSSEITNLKSISDDDNNEILTSREITPTAEPSIERHSTNFTKALIMNSSIEGNENNPPEKSESQPAGMITGAVIGVFGGVTVISMIVFFVYRYYSNDYGNNDSDDDHDQELCFDSSNLSNDDILDSIEMISVENSSGL